MCFLFKKKKKPVKKPPVIIKPPVTPKPVPTPARATISISDAQATENVKELRFDVTRTGNLSKPSIIAYKTSPGTTLAPNDYVGLDTATPGVDYVTDAGKFEMKAGENTYRLVVKVVNDDIFEKFETLQIALTATTYGTIVKSIGTGIILNDDAEVKPTPTPVPTPMPVPDPKPVPEPTPVPTPVPAPTPPPIVVVIPPVVVPPVIIPEGDDKFVNINIGGAGFVTARQFSPTGKWQVAGTDTAQSFIRAKDDTHWRQTLLGHTIPAFPTFTLPQGMDSLTDNGGSYAQAVGDDGVAYSVFKGFLMRSDDAFNSRATIIQGPMRSTENTGAVRAWAHKMVLSPINSSILLIGYRGAGLYGGAWYSNDGGRTPLVRIEGIPDPVNLEGGTTPLLVDVDPKNANRWLINSFGNGCYVSTNGVAGPYSLVAGSSKSAIECRFDHHGRIWTVEYAPQGVGQPSPVRYFENNVWTAAFTDPMDIRTVAVDPLDKNRIYCQNPNGALQRSYKDETRGWRFEGFEYGHWPAGMTYNAPNNAWMQNAPDAPMSTGIFPSNAEFDPNVPGRVHIAHGVGTCYIDLPDKWGVRLNWWDTSTGIEQLCCNGGISVPGGKFWLAGWDKGHWDFTEDFTVGAKARYPEFSEFTHTWFMDRSPSNHTVIALCNSSQHGHETCYSIDNGPWTKCKAQHPDGFAFGGSIHAASDTHWVWAPANNRPAVYTEDKGDSWHLVDFGIPMPKDNAESGWTWAWYMNRTHAVASKEVPGRVWMCNYGPNGFPDLQGIWQSENGGAGPWTHVYKGFFKDEDNTEWHWMGFHHFQFEEVPGHANWLIIAGGPDHDEPLLISKDGGVSWKKLGEGARGVTDFSFGAKKNASDPHYVMRFYGIVNGVEGVYEVANIDAPVTKFITQYPAGQVTDRVRTIVGDMNVYGRWAYGIGGSGFRGSTKG